MFVECLPVAILQINKNEISPFRLRLALFSIFPGICVTVAGVLVKSQCKLNIHKFVDSTNTWQNGFLLTRTRYSTKYPIHSNAIDQ